MAILRGTRLFGCNLANGTLTKANLEKADLRCANLRDARMREAEIIEADLTGASLYGINLSLSNLEKSIFNNADMREARLRSVTNFEKAEWIGIDYGENPNWIAPLYYSMVTLSTLGYGDIVPITSLARVVALVEVMVGYVMLGGLLSIFANKMARRGE